MKKNIPTIKIKLMDSLTKKITQGYILSFISEKIDQHTAGFLNLAYINLKKCAEITTSLVM